MGPSQEMTRIWPQTSSLCPPGPQHADLGPESAAAEKDLGLMWVGWACRCICDEVLTCVRVLSSRGWSWSCRDHVWRPDGPLITTMSGGRSAAHVTDPPISFRHVQVCFWSLCVCYCCGQGFLSDSGLTLRRSWSFLQHGQDHRIF